MIGICQQFYLNYFKNLTSFRYIYSSYSSIRNKTEKQEIFLLKFEFVFCVIACIVLDKGI